MEKSGEEWEQTCAVASCAPPSGDMACNPGKCQDREPNQWSFGSQAGAQSTELHQLELQGEVYG